MQVKLVSVLNTCFLKEQLLDFANPMAAVVLSSSLFNDAVSINVGQALS